MNVIGDRAFNMYLNAETEKPRRPPLNRDQIAAAILRRVTRFASYKCYCSGAAPKAIAVPTEEKHVTEILISSLHNSNAEHILSLTQNYIVEELALSEISLRSFFAFLANTPNCGAEKARIQAALNEHLRMHPSCAAPLVQRYRNLMLARDDDFAGLNVVEYVVSKLEQLVSVDNDVRISSRRTSRRRRQPTAAAGEPKRPKKVEVFVDADADDVEAQHPDVENLVTLLEHVTNVLRHDLGYTLKRREPVLSCIVGRLMFDGGELGAGLPAPNSSLVTRICEVLKNAETLPVVYGICELLELVCDVCALQQAENEPNGGYDVEVPGPCRTLISEFCASVIGEKPSPSKVLPVLLNLRPAWLRYHAVRYLIERVFCRKVPYGLAGVASLFGSIQRSVRERVMDTTKILKMVSGNQRTGSETTTADEKKSMKNESNSYAAHGALGKLSSAKSEQKSEFGTGEDENKSIDLNVRQKLTPFMCELLFVFVDSTITIVKLAGMIDNFKTTEDSHNLKNILNELCGEKHVPIEMNILRRNLNKIL